MAITLEEIAQLFKEGYSTGQVIVKTLAAADVPERVTDQKIPIAIMLVKAKRLNGGNIEVGFDEHLVVGEGYELPPEAPLSIPIDRADKVWIITDNATDGVEIICLV